MSERPQMIAVLSTNIARVGFANGEQGEPGELWVDFQEGSTYVYEGVPAQTFYELLASQSRGAFLAQRIKGQFTHRAVDAEQ